MKNLKVIPGKLLKFLVVLFLISSAVVAQSSYFFYSFSNDPWTFNRRDSDGSNATLVYTPPNDMVYSSAVDHSINKVYFYDQSVGGTRTIYKANYDGTSRTAIVLPTANISSLAAANGYLFYSYNANPFSIRRINSDGTGDIQVYLNATNGLVQQIAVDAENEYLYFFENDYDGSGNHRLVRTDFSGGNLTVIYNDCVIMNCITASKDYIYYADNTYLYRRNSDGTGLTTVYSPPTGTVKDCAYNTAIDRLFFYDDAATKVIYSSNPDGSDRTSVYSDFTQNITSLSAPVKASTPEVTFTSGSTFTGSATANTTNNVIGRFYLEANNTGATLSSVSINVAGTNQGVSNIKLWSSTDASFGGDTELDSEADGSSVTFSSLTSVISTSGTYYFVTTDLASNATGTLTLTIASQANISISSGIFTSTFTNAALSDGTVTITAIKEINIKGNGTSIADGDSSPASGDGTDFGNADILTGSVEKEFTIESLGGLTLSLTDPSPFVSIGGTHSGDFSLSLTPSGSISSGSTTTFKITFDPTATGTRSATISIANDDADENPYNFSIQGTGISAPEMNIKGNNVSIADGDALPTTTDDTDFGNIDINGVTHEHTFTIENSGSAALSLTDASPYVIIGGHTSDFTLTHTPSNSISAAGGTTTFKITFNPTTSGTRSATISIANNDGDENPYNFSVQGTGIYVAPTTQANTITFSNVAASKATISWTNGNGSARAVFLCQGTTGSASPVDDDTYTANTAFESGTQIGASGWYCVYNGTGTSVNVTGLLSGATYRAMVCDYNGTAGLEKYNTATATDNPANQQAVLVLINEVDSDTEGTDTKEFIELYDGGLGNISLDGLVLVFYNGNGDVSYRDIDLDGESTDVNGYYLIGNSLVSGVDFIFPDNTLQNGPDAVALYRGDGADFTNGVTTVTSVDLVDAIVYDNGEADDAGLLTLLNASEPQVNEDGNSNKLYHSLQRIPNGTGGARNTSTYSAEWPTPKAVNAQATEIRVEGKSVEIVDGDTTPDAADDTDFGKTDLVSGTVTKTYIIKNYGTVALTITSITLSDETHFQISGAVPTTIAANGIDSLRVKFDPATAGEQTATVTINNNDPDESVFDFSIKGTGVDIIVPATQAHTIVFSSVHAAKLSLSWTRGDGDKCAVFVKKTDTGTAAPVNDAAYTSDWTIGNGDQIGTTGWYCVYNNTGTSTNVYGIMPGETYRLMVCEYNEVSGLIRYNGAASDANPSNQLTKNIVINEIDSDTPGATDQLEFIELYDGGIGNVSLDYLTIVFFEGGGDLSYTSIDLDGGTTDADGYYVIGNSGVTGVDKVFADNTLKNTVNANAVALYVADAAIDFPNNTAVNTTDLVDAIVYDTGQADDAGLLVLLNASEPQINETMRGDPETYSLQRLPNGSGGLRNTSDYLAETPTPGSVNLALPEIVIKGNDVEILDGDTTPAVADSTIFPAVAVNGGYSLRTYTIYSFGTDSLTIDSLNITGANSSEFSIYSSPLSPLETDASSEFQIKFDPTGSGTRTAVINVYSDDSNENPYNFAVQGDGLVPQMVISGNTVDITNGDATPSAADYTEYGAVDLTTGEVSHTFTITNNGSAPLNLSGSTPFVTINGHTDDFVLTASPASTIAAGGGTTTFDIKFNPTSAGLREAVISITSDDIDDTPYSFSIQGTGGSYPEISIEYEGTEIVDGDASPSTEDGTDFGSDLSGYAAYSPEHTFMIINHGSADLILASGLRVSVTGTDFSLIQDAPATVAAGDTATFKVKFAASAAAVRTGTISIENNDSGENPYNFSIRGTGYTGPLMIVQGGSPQKDILNGDNSAATDDDTDFGSVIIGGAAIEHTFEIENFGSGALSLSGSPRVELISGDVGSFNVSLQPGASIAGGSNDIFKIQFDPDGSGDKNVTVRIANDDPENSTYQFAIKGLCLNEQEIDLRQNGDSFTSGSTIGYGVVPLLSSAEKIFEIYNTGDVDLTFTTPLTTTGVNASEFVVTQQPSSPVSGGSSSQFKIRFTPSSRGTKTASLSITNNDSDENPFVINLDGSSTASPEIAVKQSSSSILTGATFNFESVEVDSASEVEFKIENIGNLNLILTLPLEINGADTAAFQITEQPVKYISPGSFTNFKIKFIPQVIGRKYAELKIKNNDSNENPFVILLEGTATGQPVFVFEKNTEPIINGGTFEFTKIHCDSSSHETFLIKNDGNDTLKIISPIKITGTDSLLFSLVETVADVILPGASDSITISFAPITAGVKTARLKINNNDSLNNSFVVNLEGEAFDPAPLISFASIDTLIFVEGDSAKVIFENLSIQDYDSNILSRAEVSMLSNYCCHEDTLICQADNGVSFHFDDSTGIFTLHGPGSLEEYREAINGLMYLNMDNINPMSCNKNIQVKIWDEANNESNSIIRSVKIISVNSAPVITGLPESLTLFPDSTSRINLFGCVMDSETCDSLLNYTFGCSSDSIKVVLNYPTGELLITPIGELIGVAELRVIVEDDEGAETSAIIELKVDYTSVASGEEVPLTYILKQNYPNPFNPQTNISFGLPELSLVKIEMFDVLGRLVEVILDEERQPGYHLVIWNANKYSSGVYFYRLTAKSQVSNLLFVKVKKTILLR